MTFYYFDKIKIFGTIPVSSSFILSNSFPYKRAIICIIIFINECYQMTTSHTVFGKNFNVTFSQKNNMMSVKQHIKILWETWTLADYWRTTNLGTVVLIIVYYVSMCITHIINNNEHYCSQVCSLFHLIDITRLKSVQGFLLNVW